MFALSFSAKLKSSRGIRTLNLAGCLLYPIAITLRRQTEGSASRIKTEGLGLFLWFYQAKVQWCVGVDHMAELALAWHWCKPWQPITTHIGNSERTLDTSKSNTHLLKGKSNNDLSQLTVLLFIFLFLHEMIFFLKIRLWWDSNPQPPD